jgi:MFS family permease
MENKGFPRPFAGNYGVMLTVAIFAISSFIVITTASGLYRPQVASDLGTSLTALSVISGIATAGYAFGALLGGDFNQRFQQRNVFIIFDSLFILGCGLTAGAQGVVMFGAGSVLAGLATGLLLIAALPPVIQPFPPAHMPITAAVVNIGFFGAVTIGPLVGGAVAFGEVGRTLALVELVRSEADFILAPVMVQVAQVTSPGKALALSGIDQAILITVLIAGGTTVLGIMLHLASAGPHLPEVNLEGWLQASEPAFQSPPFGAAARGE